MLGRCKNKEHQSYKNYGGRGITVCHRWNDFRNFLADMGEHSNGLSIDRIDNNKGYSKENCRWATKKEQANNCRRNKRIVIHGFVFSSSSWAEIMGINKQTLHNRIKNGWSEYDAVMKPATAKGDLLRGKEFVARKLCETCGRRFYVAPSALRRGRLVGGKFCSKSCKHSYLSKLLPTPEKPDLEKPSTRADSDGGGYCRGCGTTIGELHHPGCDLRRGT